MHCRIPAELHLRLRLLAAERKCTITSLVVQAVEEYFAGRSLMKSRHTDVQRYRHTSRNGGLLLRRAQKWNVMGMQVSDGDKVRA